MYEGGGGVGPRLTCRDKAAIQHKNGDIWSVHGNVQPRDVDSSSTKGTKGTSPSKNGIDDKCLKAFSGQWPATT